MNTQQWLEKLISFDTTSRNSNLALIEVINNYFIQHNLHPRLTYDASRQKANIFATLPAIDGSTQGGIVLSGHTDVVPIDGQNWQTNPFKATLADDKIYGRGTTDMKGFIAVVLALLPQMQKMQLAKPVHFAFSYDEEVGCLGAVHLIEDLIQHGVKPDACIVGEPTMMLPIVAHKGINLFRCRVQGKPMHSSLTHQGCNAIDYAAELITFLRQYADSFRQQGPFDQDFDVPYTTISTNLITGGNAFNIVPGSCEFFFEFRNLPTMHPKAIAKEIYAYIESVLLPKIKKEDPEARIDLEALTAAPSFEGSESSDITQLLRKITGYDITKKVAYTTEAGLFQNAGIPTILCGPGSIEQAHRPNEFIAVSELQKCEDILTRLLIGLS